MEDVLKRLLEAESRAEALVRKAEAERDAMVKRAEAEARALDEAFAARIPEIRNRYLQKAEEEAAQKLKELERHYEELKVRIRNSAQQHEPEAVKAAIALLLDTDKG